VLRAQTERIPDIAAEDEDVGRIKAGGECAERTSTASQYAAIAAFLERP
jgi:hypothetical protein